LLIIAILAKSASRFYHYPEISYDSGFVEVDMDGQKVKMNTSKKDFGTILDE